MVTTGITTGVLVASNGAGRSERRWGYALIGDPLLRADDKFVHGLGERVLASLTDLRIVRELRVRAESKLADLAQQLDDLTARNVTDLVPAAARELADQEALLSRLAAAEAAA